MQQINDEKFLELERINREVNQRIIYRSDKEIFGESEFWAVAKEYGDCEDFALVKLETLLDHGWDRVNLRLTTCWTETREYHAVLTVETNHGTYVLDNRFDKVVPWAILRYKWHKREIPGSGMWEKINR